MPPRAAPPPDDPFEALWAHREDVIFPSLLGPSGKGVYALTPDAFRNLGATAIDPRWCTYNVRRHRPTASRPTTVHLSHGLSLPWETMEPGEWKPDGSPGMGYEILLQTPRAWGWALELASGLLAYATLIASGLSPYRAPEPFLRHGARIGWGRPVDGRPRCRFTTVFLMNPPRLPDGFSDASGRVDFLQATCITEREADFSRREGADALATLLDRAGAACFHPADSRPIDPR